MSISPICDFCHAELQEMGGLLFSPPTDDMVKKYHLCAKCYDRLSATIKMQIDVKEIQEAHISNHIDKIIDKGFWDSVENTYDSMCLSDVAESMRYLAKVEKFSIITECGRRVIGKFIKELK